MFDSFCGLIWPFYLVYFLYLNYKWLMAAGHRFGEKDKINLASADVLLTALLIVISFSLCQLELQAVSAGVMLVHLVITQCKPRWITDWIYISEDENE